MKDTAALKNTGWPHIDGTGFDSRFLHSPLCHRTCAVQDELRASAL